MRSRLSLKLFLALLATTGVVVVLILGLIRQSMGRGFQEYLELKQEERMTELAAGLAAAYVQYGDWGYLLRDRGQWRRLVEPDRPEPPPRRPPPDAFGLPPGGPPLWEPGRDRLPPLAPPGREGDMRPPPGPGLGPPGPHGITLFDAARNRLIGPEPSPEGLRLVPVEVEGETVGWLGTPALPPPSSEAELRFLERQQQALMLIGMITLLVAGIASSLLAWRLLRPVKAVAAGARALAAGQFGSRVEVKGRDEIAGLAADFNHLAETLERNESARRRWIADISHELRTPLAVLRGEIEALQDGVRAATPENIASLHGEVQQLTKLVEDLYQLALSDLGALSYRMEGLTPAELVEEAVATFRNRFQEAGIALEPVIAPCGEIDGDRQRLSQLLHNLLENSLRYTDRGGRAVLRVAQREAEVVIELIDSAPGVPAERLERLFDPLYREEGSRNRARGGAGLGLAICRNIVEAHQGVIEALPSPFGGVRIRVRLRTVR